MKNYMLLLLIMLGSLGAWSQTNYDEPNTAGSSGTYNVSLGYNAGYDGTYNTVVGYEAGNNIEGNYSSFFGARVGMNATGDNNSAFGYYAGYDLTTGDHNSFFGSNAGFNTTTGYYNSFFGSNAGYDLTTGDYNSFFGSSAGYSTTTGIANSFFGTNAGYNTTTGGYNVAIGRYSNYSNSTGSYTVTVGYYAGYSNTASNNMFVGAYSGRYNTSGTGNTYLGYYAGYSGSTGSNNVFIGYQAGYSETGSNKLYIDNSNTTTPLIYGDFSTNQVGINAAPGSYTLNIGGSINATSFNLNGVPFTGSNWTLASGNVYRSTGNVGIGSTAPDTKLQVDIASANTTYASATNSDVSLTLKNSNTTNNNLNILNFADGNGFAATQVGTVVSNHTTHTGKLFFSTRSAGGLTQKMSIDENGFVTIGSMSSGYVFLNVGGTTAMKRLYIDSTDPMIQTPQDTPLDIYDENENPVGLNAGGILISDDYGYATPADGNLVVKGAIGIGTPFTSNPNAYKLAVNGKIGAKDLQIETSTTTWPDYVFEKSYKLPALSDVERYVKENKHLEGMPSVAEVKEKGYSVNELNEALLKKVEELTLYLIEQQKQIDELKKEVSGKKRKK